jgi:hypothetical protein
MQYLLRIHLPPISLGFEPITSSTRFSDMVVMQRGGYFVEGVDGGIGWGDWCRLRSELMKDVEEPQGEYMNSEGAGTTWPMRELPVIVRRVAATLA